MSPPPFNPGFVNFNAGNTSTGQIALDERVSVLGAVFHVGRLGLVAQNPADHEAFHEKLVDWEAPPGEDEEYSAYSLPHSTIIQPIFSELYQDDVSDVTGFITGIVPWDVYMTNLLPQGVRGISCILENTCGQKFSYELDGSRVRFFFVAVRR